MEDFYYEESNPKHIFLKCLGIIFIIGIFIGVFFFYKNKNTIKLNDITIEVGEKLSNNIEDYLVNGSKFSHEYKLYLNDVNTNKVGEYEYKVKYNKHIVSGSIKVVDKTKPEVIVNNLTIGINEELNPNDLILSCKDASLPCRVVLEKENDINKLKKVGTYSLSILVSDAAGNITKTNVNVTTSETETLSSLQTDNLEYYINSESDKGLGKDLFIRLDKAIEEETLEYEGLIHEVSAIDFNEYKKEEKEIYDTKLITAYNKYGYVIGIQVLITYNDGTNELLIK